MQIVGRKGYARRRGKRKSDKKFLWFCRRCDDVKEGGA